MQHHQDLNLEASVSHVTTEQWNSKGPLNNTRKFHFQNDLLKCVSSDWYTYKTHGPVSIHSYSTFESLLMSFCPQNDVLQHLPSVVLKEKKATCKKKSLSLDKEKYTKLPASIYFYIIYNGSWRVFSLPEPWLLWNTNFLCHNMMF